jgi:tetratricopeptide (TPR) repeat protein
MNRVMKLVGLIAVSLLPVLAQSSSGRMGSSDTAKERPDPTVYSQNPEANSLYVEGQNYLNKSNTRNGGTLANARQAVNRFERAVKDDPQFTLAYIGLADAWGSFSFSVPGALPAKEIYPHEEAAALEAARLDPTLPRAHSLLAGVYFNNEYDWTAAEREYKRVIELTDSATSHSAYGTFLATQGRFDDAIAEVKRCAELDPLSAMSNIDMLEIYYWRHQDDQAIEQGNEALRKDPTAIYAHFIMGFAYVHKGQVDDAVREFKYVTPRGDAGSLSALGCAYAMAGNKVETRRVFEQLTQHPSAKLVPYRIAAIYVALGDKDRAIRLIEEDYQNHSNWLNRVRVDPVMDPLREEPRFKALLHKMKFQS